MSFFKKKKSKIGDSKAANNQQKSKLAKEIEKMDEQRHLDMQLEELTARLNATDENKFTPSEQPPVKAGTPKAFISESLKDFSTPEFTASVQSGVTNIDVTSNTEAESKSIVELEPEKITTAAVMKAPAPEPFTERKDEAESLPDVSQDLGLGGPQRLDMSEMRIDVAKISADIQSGEELYRRALNRVEGLMGFVEKAEIDFSVLNRLEPENRRLKAKLRTANGDVETIKGKIALVTADLEDRQNRLDEKSKQYEAVRAKLATAASSLQEYKRLLKANKTEAERYALTVDRQKTAISVESTENKVLREKVNELSSALSLRQQEYLEVSKVVESLKADCVDYRQQAETYRTEAQDLRITLNTAKRQNSAMKSEMAALHEDIKTFKTQYEFNVISREDQVTDLEAQVEFLAKEADIKTNLAHAATQDIATLRNVRNAQDIERDKLEKQLALALAEIRDMQSTAESQASEKVRALEAELRRIEGELALRDDYKQASSKQLTKAERTIEELTKERDSLRNQMKTQSQKFETIVKSNPTEQLNEQISKLSEQLRIKDDIVSSAATDIAQLARERDAQKAENKRLEELIHAQTFQLEAAQNDLRKSKETETELDQKYRDIAAALSVNQSRRRSESDAATPDIVPDISDDYDGLSVDDVEDRIMDYKFGIRKDII